MALRKDMLAPDEQVVLHLRTHLKSLIGAILILFLASALLTIPSRSNRGAPGFWSLSSWP